MKATYQIVNFKDSLHDGAAIVHTLRAMHDGLKRNDLRLINYHHEIPISYPVVIERIDQDMVDLQVHPNQAVVLSTQRQALLKSAAFPKGLGVHAIAEYVNIRNSFVTLGRFVYANIRAERRDTVRVAVEERTDAVYWADNQKAAGQLLDISLGGIALLSEAALPVGIAERGEIRFSLLGAPLEAPAQLVGSRRREGGYLHTFRIEVDTQTDLAISQFIYARQVEIIRDLKEKLSEAKGETV